MLLLHGGKGPVLTPADFGTLEAWIDPRHELTESAGAVTDWNDHSANAHAGTIIGSPAYEATGWNGQPSVQFNGSSSAAAFDGVAAAASGTDVPIFVFGAVQILTHTNSARIWTFSNSTVIESGRHHALFLQSSNRYQVSRRDDAATTVAAASDVNFADLNRHLLEDLFFGTTRTLVKDATTDTLINGVSHDNGANTLDQFTIAVGRGSGNTNWANLRVGPILVYSGSLPDQAAIRAWYASEGY